MAVYRVDFVDLRIGLVARRAVHRSQLVVRLMRRSTELVVGVIRLIVNSGTILIVLRSHHKNSTNGLIIYLYYYFHI